MDTTSIDREKFVLGRAALKTKIKALSAAQKRDKGVLRITRKLSKTKEEKEAALAAAGYKPGTGPTAWECMERRMQITAYLNVYATIRGRTPHKVPDWYYPHTYRTYFNEAQALFEQATKPEPVA